MDVGLKREDRSVARVPGDTGEARRSRHGVVGDERDSGRLDVVARRERCDAAGRGAGDGISDGLVQRIHRVVGLREHAGPASAGALEYDLDGPLQAFEVVGGSERVEDASERFLAAVRI
jgi:hypothetical protein